MGLTRKRRLRFGRSVWPAVSSTVPLASVPLDRQADVLIVGAGISGALLAWQLTEAGRKPLIVDRRPPVSGSTPASTALLQFETDTPLVLLSRKIGRRRAERAWLRSQGAVNDLRTATRVARIDASLISRPSLYLAGTLLDAAGLRPEARARQRIGLPSEYLTDRQLRRHFGIRRSAAILSHGNAEANPAKLTAGFLRAAIRAGARVCSPVEVASVESRARRVDVMLSSGAEIRAGHVVFCTGYELPKIVGAWGHSVESTWAMATARQARKLWPERALIWESADPYLYLRSTPDGRVLCGGEDEDCADEASRDALLPAKIRALEKQLGRLMPELDPSAAFAWAGSFGSSETGLPSIGAIPGFPRCYAVLGYGGNGITFSMLAAKLVTAALQGRPDPDSELFALPR